MHKDRFNIYYMTSRKGRLGGNVSIRILTLIILSLNSFDNIQNALPATYIGTTNTMIGLYFTRERENYYSRKATSEIREKQSNRLLFSYNGTTIQVRQVSPEKKYSILHGERKSIHNTTIDTIINIC